MRFLHLSDLHIGKSVNGFSMLAEQRHALRQIIGYVQSEGPDAAVIAGDVYDRAVPGVEAVRAFDDFLTELAREGIAVLLISGNHDSPERLNYASRLLSDKRLYLCGAFDGALRKVTLTDEYGEVNFWLLPFIKPSYIRADGGDGRTESYSDALAAALATADIDCDARNVLVSHQFFTRAGVTPVRSESEMNLVGGLDAIDAGIVDKFDYVALGHLHGAQQVGRERIRYCGSPVKYSFSEWRHDKSVTLAELGEKGRLTVTALPLTPLHDMREIKGKLDRLLSEEALAPAGGAESQGLSQTAPNGREDYLRVILTDEEEIIDPMGKLRSFYPNIMSLDFENSRVRPETAEVSVNAEKVERLSPYELFGEFFLDMTGCVMSAEQAEIVRELLETEEAL
jgi:exonuclease SbcD